MDRKRVIPLALILVMASAGLATAATLWVTSLTGSVTLAPSQYFTKIFSDPDTCLIPMTAIAFGTVTAAYGGPSSSEWITVTLQIQTPVPAGTKLYILAALTGSLPTGATIEIQRQKSTDLSWVPETFADRGFLGNLAPTISPVVNNLQVQRWRYRVTFAQGAVFGVFNAFGIEYTVSDV